MYLRWLSVSLLTAGALLVGAETPVRVLILSGQNNHDWKSTTPYLRQLCEDSGRFVVTVTEKPEALGAADLAQADVLLSNWNAFGAQAADWPLEPRSAFLDFVRGGKGLVSVHAGSSSFPEWAEYQDLVMGSWKLGQTGHGPIHAFAVSITQPTHPIMQGLPEFWTEDELWHAVPLRGDPTVLATAFSAVDSGGSGKVEPIVFAREFGQGRSLTILLGHDLRALQNPGCRALLTRGVEWAATGNVTLPVPPDLPADELAQALLAAAAYTFGQDRACLRRAEAFVLRALADDARRQDVAARLVRLLSSPTASTEGKRFACEQLAVAGGPAEVPALSGWLGDEALGVSARGALERIGGEPAAAALRQALGAVPQAQRPGVAASLGRLRDPAAVGPLREFVDPGQPVLATAALRALAAIGSDDALAALLTLDQRVGETLRGPWSEAVLAAADTASATTASPAVQRLTQADCPAHVRRSALRQTLAAAGAGRAAALGAALGSGDAVRCGAALDLLRDRTALPAAEAAACAASAFDAAAEDTQSQLVAILEARGGADSLRVVRAAVTSPAVAIRCRALTALGVLGDAECVPLLASRAAEATGDEARALTAALSRLDGETTDAALADAVGGALPHAVPLLVEALLNRHAKGATPVLLKAIERGGEAAQAALRALGELGDDAAFAGIVDRVSQGHCEAPETSVRQALTDIAQRRAETPAGPALAALATVPDSTTKALLIGVLGALGGEEALTAVQAGLDPANPLVRLASLRALSGWQTAAPCDALVGVLEASADPVEQVLAARGVARMLGADSGRALDARLTLLHRALVAAKGSETTTELLKGTPTVRSPQTLAALLPYLAPGSTSAAAAQAILALAEALQGSHPAETAQALRAVAAECYDSPLQERAALFHRGVVAGPNLAVGATADSRDGLAPDNEGRGPEAAIDGNPATYWDDQDDQKAYHLAVTLTQPAVVGSIAITGFFQHNYAPRDFEVVCDGRLVRTVSGAAYENNRLVVALPPGRCQTLELRISGYYGKSPAVRELEVFGPPLAEPGKEQLAWERTPGALSLLNGERTVWRFNYATGHAKPYIHPLALKDGTTLTATSPPDHPWHHGLWFSWKLINGLNYWEEDKTTGRSQGLTSWAPPQVETRDDFSATLRLGLSYGPPGSDPVLREERTMEISAPGADGGYRLDWTLVFTAVAEPVLLDRTPIPGEPNGVDYGGYAGFSARVARDLAEWKVLNASGLVGTEGHRRPASAMDFSGTAGGVAAGLAILDHPSNLNAPSPWFVVMDQATPFGYFSPAVVCLQPYTLRRGEAFTLRYRVLVHPGALDAAGLQSAVADFAR